MTGTAAIARSIDARPASVSDFDRFIFVVGAPRCGTTTLSRFLKEHPAINFPALKEPHYFALNDLRGLSDEELKGRVESEFLARFFRHDPQRRVGADCSVTYLYMPELLEPVLRLWPNSRFIIALRDPLTMLPSLHRRLVFIGDEQFPTFEKAWAAVPDRARGRRIHRRCSDPRFLRYDEAGRFGTYVERLFNVVGRDRCLPVIFDDLSKDPEGQYRRVMEFCGLDAVPGMDFTAQRTGKGVRFHWLQRILKRPPVALRNYLVTDLHLKRTGDDEEAAEAKARGKIMSLRKRLLRWNRVARPAERVSPHVQRQVRAKLKDEIDRLGRLLDRDLTHWLKPDDEKAA